MITVFDGMSITEIIKLFSPLIVIELCLKIFCFYRLYKDKVNLLPKYIWIVIILFINTLGPIAFLLAGRKKD